MCTDGYEKKVLFWQLIRHRHLTSIFHCEFWRRSLYFCKSSNLIRIRLVKPLLYDIKYHTRIPKIKFRILVFKEKGFILNLFCICPFCVLLLDFLYYSFFFQHFKESRAHQLDIQYNDEFDAYFYSKNHYVFIACYFHTSMNYPREVFKWLFNWKIMQTWEHIQI